MKIKTTVEELHHVVYRALRDFHDGQRVAEKGYSDGHSIYAGHGPRATECHHPTCVALQAKLELLRKDPEVTDWRNVCQWPDSTGCMWMLCSHKVQRLVSLSAVFIGNADEREVAIWDPDSEAFKTFARSLTYAADWAGNGKPE